MTVLGIRFCKVSPPEDAEGLARFLGADGWGFAERDLGGDAFQGAVFPAGEASWVEVWPAAQGMPQGVMLQIMVDDADAYAAAARDKGVVVNGPTDAHGERIYMCSAPGGLPMAVLSKLPAAG